MEGILSQLGGGADLAAIASGAGLLGGGTSTILALMIGGKIVRFIVRTILTAALTGIGFYFLLGALGFRIVPAEEVAAVRPQGEGFVGIESVAATVPTEPGKTTYVINSPFRKDKKEKDGDAS